MKKSGIHCSRPCALGNMDLPWPTLLSTSSEMVHTGQFRELLHSADQRRCRSISLRQSDAAQKVCKARIGA
jgi:hypothetical protein